MKDKVKQEIEVFFDCFMNGVFLILLTCVYIVSLIIICLGATGIVVWTFVGIKWIIFDSPITVKIIIAILAIAGLGQRTLKWR